MLDWIRPLLFAVLALAAQPGRAQPPTDLELWRRAHPEIRIAPDPDFAPIDSLDAKNQQQGLAADYLKLIGQRTGLKFRVVPVGSWSEAMEALRERRVDMLSAAFASKAREEFALFTAPYLRLPCAVFVRADSGLKLDQIDGRSIGVALEHVCQEDLAPLARKAQITVLRNSTEALKALVDGKVDALAGDLVTLQAAANRLGVRDRLSIAGQIGADGPLSFAVRKDWPQLKQILDEALAGIDVDDEAQLRQRWLKDLLPSDPAKDAQTSTPDEALPPGLAPALEAARKALAEQKSLAADDVRAATEALDAADADERKSETLLVERQTLRDAAAKADTDNAALDQALARDDTAALLTWRASLPERASVEQLEGLLGRERAALADARAAVNTLQSDAARQLERPAQIRKELKNAQAQIAAPADADKAADKTAGVVADAKRLQHEAARRLAQITVAKLEDELRSYEPRLRLASAQLRENQREAAQRQQKVDALQNLILDRNTAVASAINERMRKEADAFAPAGPALAAPARQNVAYADELSRATRRLAEIRVLREDYAKNRIATEQALKNTKERVDIGGVTEAVGLILLAEREKLQPAAALKRKLAALQTELAQAKIRLIDLRELGTSLDDPAARVDEQVKLLPPGTENTTALRQSLFRVFGARAEVVAQLSLAQRSLADALADTEQELKSLTDASAALRDLLDAHLLWTPSHGPVDRNWPLAIASGALDAFRPDRWWDAAKLAVNLAVGRPASTLAGLALVVALLLYRRRIPAKLDAIATPMRRIRTDRYRLSGEAFALSLVATLPLPLAVWLGSRLLQRAGDAGYVFSDALGLTLGQMVPTVAMLSFMRWLTADKGLAATHFRWNPSRRQALDTIRRWLTFGLVPAMFLLLMYFNYGEQFANAGFARAVLIVGCLLLARLVWQVMAPGVLWSSRTLEPVRTRQLLRIGLTGAVLGLVMLALAGYLLTAVTLAGRLVESGSAFLALATLNGMALRWLSLGERRLALKRMEEKREADGARDDAELETRPEFVAEAEQITLASINQQTRRLLRALTTVVLAATLLWVWSDVTPALSYLGNIDAWKSSYTADGKAMEVTVNLRSLLFAVVALMLTWVATRNLPGLLEIGVLRRLNVDAPTRYAITAISRYAIAIFGTVFGLSLFGLRWGQLQWMAAALTVGLGFGLQEIFANFVSGLIVLFERPIRVGDVISIGGIEGTVTRIRTRATTVVDWDNREVVIPNKTFITSQLTNWTLTDAVTRVVIKLGVGYDSDPEAVRALLLDVARAHPKVLKEPGPNCWCVALADSTLNFELRVFVGDTLERNAVRNDLHGTILREFRAHKIEIAFPQMDVWVRAAPALPAADAPKPEAAS